MYNLNSGYGLAESVRAHLGIMTLGKIMIVCPSTDPNFDRLSDLFKPDATGDANQVRLYQTLEAAYAAAVTNANDVILLQGHSGHTVAAGIDWTKSRIHVLGMDGGDRLIQQGAKVQSTVGAADAYVVKVTGTRNTFENIKFIQADTDAAALTVLQFGGEGTVVKNCSAVFGVATRLAGATTYEVVMGEDSGTFINCEFGTATLVTGAARAIMLIDQVKPGQEMKECRFKDCNFAIASTDAAANFIRVSGTADLKFGTLMKDCTFLATINATMVAITLTDAVESVGSLVEGNILFVNPATNATSFSGTTSDNFKVVGALGVAATTGVGIVPS